MDLVLAFADQEIAMWTIALGIGAVVIVVVIALLTVLLKIVHDIDRNVFGVWEMAKRLAANTATTWQLNATASTLEEVKKEALAHDELLASRR
ncbi:MAG: hypothetical protein ABR575_01195 [Actinomycetota bacterium]